MKTFIKVASVREIPDNQGKAVAVGDTSVAVFQVNGQFCAVANTCPHRGASLAEGDVEGTVVTCPWHGWQFDLITGQSPVNPAAKIITYPCRVDGDSISISMEP